MPSADTVTVPVSVELTLTDLELRQWCAYADQVLVMAIATEHAADQIADIIADAEQTLAEMGRYIEAKQREHAHSH